VGDWVLAVGRTAGGGVTVSAGIACETRSAKESGRDDPIRTDAVITGLNAGGPLVDLEGKVVGISLARGEPGSPNDGFSQAIPESLARRVATELAGFGRVKRGFLGLVISGDEPTSLNPRDTSPGLLITGITLGGPADLAGLRVGDRIVAVDGRPISEIEELSRQVENAPVGQRFSLTIQRAASRMEIAVQTAERPETGAPAGSLRPVVPGFRGRLRPRDSAPGQSAPPGSRRPGGVLRSEPADDSSGKAVPAPQPGSPGSGAKRKGDKPEPAPEAAPEPDPSLPPALDPDPSHSF
jgi:serine protease Do